MFHDGHSDPIEGGILMRKKKQTPGREKKTQGMRASRKPGGEATELQHRISLENVMGWVQS